MPSAGKEALISQWYHQYAQDIFSIIYLMTGDYQLAEDLTQETFIKAYRHVDTFRGEASPKTWLIKIGRHLTIDYQRRKKPIQMVLDLLIKKPSPNRPPAEVVALNESKETAEILGWSESKVKVTLHRAMEDLKSRLKERGYVHGAI